MRTVQWKRIQGNGLEYCELELNQSMEMYGEVITDFQELPAHISYTVQCGPDGATRFVEVRSRSQSGQDVFSIYRTETGRWFCHEEELPQFFGLKDIDLGITPSTNSLPIRRLQLSPGESAELTAVWLRFPDLSLRALAQRYTCIDMGSYLYESLESGYQARIQVDSDGVVVEYQNEWRRV